MKASKAGLAAAGVLGLSAALALQSFAPVDSTLSLSLTGPQPYAPNQPGGVQVTSNPGDWVIVMIDSEANGSVLPYLGGIPVALSQTSSFLQLFRINTSGTTNVMCNISCEQENLFGLKFYSQAVSYNPATTEVCTSNVVCFSWEDDGSCTPSGCTPGYWRQTHHFDDWEGYAPTDLFSSVFEDAFPGQTLHDVVDSPGLTALDQLGFHTVAALLNASSSFVNYPYTEQEIIDMFNAVYPGTDADYEALKDDLDAANNAGCPL